LGKLAAISRPRAHSPRLPARPCGYHALGGDTTFAANDCVCELGVRSSRAEGAYRRAKIAVMLDGFRAVTGQTPRQVVIATRLRAAAALLRTTRLPVMHIALDVGFGDLSHFMASFARAFGVSPGSYRASQR
jgi:hypothetical protein